MASHCAGSSTPHQSDAPASTSEHGSSRARRRPSAIASSATASRTSARCSPPQSTTPAAASRVQCRRTGRAGWSNAFGCASALRMRALRTSGAEWRTSRCLNRADVRASNSIFPRTVGALGEMVADVLRFGGHQLAVDMTTQQFMAVSASHGQPASCAPTPSASASRLRARAKRDITVPIGTPTTSLISRYERLLDLSQHDHLAEFSRKLRDRALEQRSLRPLDRRRVRFAAVGDRRNDVVSERHRDRDRSDVCVAR